ncbi:hypothetical protein dsx2_1391 [Desulfovibrio sp. X2]|uniref:hypothetical protein n=1 Tax=Desulfovibrio sp. X2 TaxID=941449 RepID=UPI000358BBF7|nr:hypothetical protein [Desulfovibrio sp. X2]EPR44763.1 hypothetical protein dsx2_1391 [Desulfovibrio sp. X2]
MHAMNDTALSPLRRALALAAFLLDALASRSGRAAARLRRPGGKTPEVPDPDFSKGMGI